MKKKIALLFGFIILAGSIWYLFIKPFDYLVTFKVKALPGTINQTIKTWAVSSDNITTVQQKDIHTISQRIKFGDSIHHYDFEIVQLNDTVSKIKVFIKDKENSFQNKLTIPFADTPFEENCIKTVKDLSRTIIDHLGDFKVTVVGEENIAPKFCAYVPLKGTQLQKASGMMKNYSLLSGYLAGKNIELDGNPLVEITKWDVATDSIYYNFCFPVIKPDTIPQNSIIQFKEIKSSKAVKAIYNGNYISSDRAWYALQQYAKNEGLETVEKPLEIFYNNPGLSSNELEWKAEIFMPLKPKS
ncbi:GyrI-like domain-containing protein [Costertonia aggregata]|uniref:AraC family transcriptional regulator n=1 Tax=Costertonia aggregata TaxID=343403 RepID=A0A7H9AQM4_9FLAO|nr:GyrI-like domain-containing protein [Costertonia aggregata]QLG45733.1 AraC family transcriptional regulator [Costertonia aggregata]